MSQSEEAYGPAAEEMFEFPPAAEQSIPEYINDILASSLTTRDPDKQRTYHAKWTDPRTGQILELTATKAVVADENQDYSHLYSLIARGAYTGDVHESFTYCENRRGKERKNTMSHERPGEDEKTRTFEQSLSYLRQYLQTAHIDGAPVVFRHGVPNEKITKCFWYMVGHNFFTSSDVYDDVQYIAHTGDATAKEALLEEMCTKPHSIPEKFAEHLLDLYIQASKPTSELPSQNL